MLHDLDLCFDFLTVVLEISKPYHIQSLYEPNMDQVSIESLKNFILIFIRVVLPSVLTISVYEIPNYVHVKLSLWNCAICKWSQWNSISMANTKCKY